MNSLTITTNASLIWLKLLRRQLWQQKRFIKVLRRKVSLPPQPKLESPYIIGPHLREYPFFRQPRPVADFIFEEVEDTEDQKDLKLKVILLKTVDEVGAAGEIVEVDRDFARYHLLSSGEAVYASPQNLELYRELIEIGSLDSSGPSSAFVKPTLKRLAKEVILVTMNNTNDWTITPKHVQLAFRMAGYQISEKCVELPSQPITGPDIEEKEGKDFAVLITINNKETVHVRCMIHHNNVPLRSNWNRKPRFVLFEQQRELLLEKMSVNDSFDENEL